MARLLIATRNPGKQREISALLRDVPCEVVFPDDVGIWELEEESRLEEAATFEGNAVRKAVYFAKRSALPVAAEDSGIEVFSLGGEPGVRSRRFAMFEGPPDEQDAANNRELLRRLAGLPPQKRRARYRCVVGYVERPDSVPQTFEGQCMGAILTEPKGEGGFGYDPLFLSDDLGVSFGEADPRDKERVSHRGRAFRSFAEWLRVNAPP
ncbi:MAG: non-canonical purine NTP pyrophosphatase [Gemmatimonadales bacterium]